MSSAQPRKRRKATKGSVQIKNSNDRLQLVFQFGGKRRYLSTGFSDTPVNRSAAEMKARQIELDIASGNFDASLKKYKPASALTTDDTVPSIGSKEPSLDELWDQFIEYKRPQCSENTMKHTYKVYTGYLGRLPTHDLQLAGEIRDFVLANIPLDSGKRFITRLSACCDLAIDSGKISRNPFAGMASKIKLPNKDEDEFDIDPFTAVEREQILEAIASNKFCRKKSAHKHSFYFPLIAFLFKTGCRPSEATALQWDHM